MIRQTAVIDTNVVISGNLASRPDPPAVWIYDGMLAARFPFLVSVDLLAEYRRILLREPIRKKHGMGADRVDKMLTEIALNAIVVEPTHAGASPPDPNDQHLWDLLAARPEAILVTGDRKLLQDPPASASVLSPRGFVELAIPQ